MIRTAFYVLICLASLYGTFYLFFVAGLAWWIIPSGIITFSVCMTSFAAATYLIVSKIIDIEN